MPETPQTCAILVLMRLDFLSPRLYRIVRMLEEAHQPVPLARFLDELEISRATFKRDLDYLRDRLGAPIEWQRAEGGAPGGYRLDGPRDNAAEHYGIRGLWFNPSEIYALLMMQQLAAGMEPGLLSQQVSGLMTRIALMLGSAADDPAEVSRRVRILHSANRRAAPPCFDTVAQATMKRQRLDLDYHTRSRRETSRRQVSPQQLVHYRENWYLLAWCHKAQALRTFALDAVLDARADNTTAEELAQEVLQDALGKNFGIIAGPARKRARLRFSADVAPWVGKEIWHPEQRLRVQPDGSILLDVPYADPREILMEILRHGPDVEVLGPAKLRAEARARLARALDHYRGD